MPHRFLIVMPTADHARLKEVAAGLDMTVTAFCRRAIATAIDLETGGTMVDQRGQINAIYRQTVLNQGDDLPPNVAEAIDALTQLGLSDTEAHRKVMAVINQFPDLESQEIIAKAFRYDEG